MTMLMIMMITITEKNKGYNKGTLKLQDKNEIWLCFSESTLGTLTVSPSSRPLNTLTHTCSFEILQAQIDVGDILQVTTFEGSRGSPFSPVCSICFAKNG
jgi:hypothetical protein